jgi:plastocyanin
MRRTLVSVLIVLAAPLSGQSLLFRSPNLGGTWVPDAGVVQFNFLHRFYVTPSIGGSPHTVINFPTFTLAIGLPANLAAGLRYATHSDVAAGNKANETELFARWRHPLGGSSGFTMSATPAYNAASRSLDGELSVDWSRGPVTLLGAVRGMSKAYGVDTARLALAGGAVLRLNSYVGVSGDVASLLSTRSGEQAAWSVGIVFAIPSSPHTFSLHASNVDVNTIEGSSRRGPASRAFDKILYGFEFTIPLHLSRFGPWFHKSRTAAVSGDVNAAVAATVTIGAMKFHADTVTIGVGQAVRWNNHDPLGHTITFDGAEPGSALINPNGAYIHLFQAPGTYTYHCTPHPFMTGVVVVR